MGKTKFEAWMERVDAAIESWYGLSSDDLPDVEYYDMFEDGWTPGDAAQYALDNAGA